MKSEKDFSRLLVGSGPNYTGYGSTYLANGEHGLLLDSQDGYRVAGLSFTNLGGAGVKCQNSAGGWQHVGILEGLSVQHSTWGYWLTTGAEYETVVGCIAANCTFGFLVETGNHMFSNCKAQFCSVGVKVFGGSNNAHGSWNGLQANHCTYNLSCQNVSLGESFVGCCFFGGQAGADQGNIQILNSQGLIFVGCQLGYIDVSFDSTSQVSFIGCSFRGPVNFTGTGSLTCKNNLVMSGASLTLNGSAFSGNT